MRFAIVPQVLPNFVSYTLLRAEINVRASTIIGAVGGGGIGEAFRLSIGRDHAAKTYAIILLLLVTIVAVDQFSGWLRRRLVGNGNRFRKEGTAAMSALAITPEERQRLTSSYPELFRKSFGRRWGLLLAALGTLLYLLFCYGFFNVGPAFVEGHWDRASTYVQDWYSWRAQPRLKIVEGRVQAAMVEPRAISRGRRHRLADASRRWLAAGRFRQRPGGGGAEGGAGPGRRCGLCDGAWAGRRSARRRAPRR